PARVTPVDGALTGFGRSNAGWFTFTRAIAQRLTVRHFGDGAGLVTSSPAGILCGRKCSHRFPFGKRVRLTATPRPHSRFIGWLGPCDGGGRCTVKMNGSELVGAIFVKK